MWNKTFQIQADWHRFKCHVFPLISALIQFCSFSVAVKCTLVKVKIQAASVLAERIGAVDRWHRLSQRTPALQTQQAGSWTITGFQGTLTPVCSVSSGSWELAFLKNSNKRAFWLFRVCLLLTDCPRQPGLSLEALETRGRHLNFSKTTCEVTQKGG